MKAVKLVSSSRLFKWLLAKLLLLYVIGFVSSLMVSAQSSSLLPCDTLVRCDVGPIADGYLPLWWGLTQTGDEIFAADPSTISIGGGNITVIGYGYSFSMTTTTLHFNTKRRMATRFMCFVFCNNRSCIKAFNTTLAATNDNA